MLTFLWHAALYTCAAVGAMSLTRVALVTVFLAREVRGAWKRERERFDAGLEKMLRDAAGDVL